MKKPKKVELTGRDKLLYDIHTIHEVMRNEAFESGIQTQHYDAIIRDEEKMTNEQLERVLGYLKKLHSGPYLEVTKVRILRPKEFWTNLKIVFQQHGLIEQKMLKAKQKEMRAFWYETSIYNYDS